MKTDTSLPYLDRLDKERQETFDKLKYFSKDFILAGGTAMMLQIGHRLSYDFDCFSAVSIRGGLLRNARKIFGESIVIKIDNSDQLTFETPQKVEVTFVLHPYPNLRPPIITPIITIFHLDDLAANKAYTIGRRGAWRDYVDLFFFLKWKLYELKEIISLAAKKFKGEFNDKLFLEQLVYFNDIPLVTTTFLKETYTDDQIKLYLEKQVGEYMERFLREA